MNTRTRSWQPGYSTRLTRRGFLGASATGLGAAALMACGGDDGGGSSLRLSSDTSREPGTVWLASNNWKLEDETKDAVPGGVYRGVMSNDNVGGYDTLTTAPSQVPVGDHIHEFLMGFRKGPGIDPGSPEYVNPVPRLAQSMELNPDGTVITFTLRPNVKFHPVAPVNGRVMDMDDWKTSLERFLATSPQRAFIQDILDRTEYPDSSHMVLRLKHPYAPFAELIADERFAFPILPKELNADPKIAASTAIGTGFKIMDKHQPALTIEYKKHREYWDREPFIDRWHFPIIPEYANRYAQFVTGNITAFTPQARDVISLKRDVPGAVIVAEELTKARISRFNFGRENATIRAYKDARVRIALRRAVNWPGIAEALSNKTQFESNGIPVEMGNTTHATRDALWYLDPEKGELGATSASYLYDVAEAKKLVQAAGFSSPPEFNYMILVGEDGAEDQVDRLMYDSMVQSGVFKPDLIATSNRVQERNCRSLRQCDAYINTGGSEYFMDYFMREQHSGGNRPGGEPVYPSPELDRIANQYRLAIDLDKRIALIKEWQTFQSGYFSMVPAEHVFTIFSLRWPWTHNVGWGGGATENLEGKEAFGGHLVWLDKEMPRRNG